MKQSSRFFLPILVIATLLFPALANGQRGARVAHRNLDQLTAEAALIVRGRVASARVEQHPQLTNLATVVVTMSVDRTLKGSAAKRLEFRQYIWDIRDRIDNARYTKGQELLLLLGPESPYGLRSPVGLDQGRFRIERDRSGRATAVNGAANSGLFDGASESARGRGVKVSERAQRVMSTRVAGPVELEGLEEAIRALGGTR